MIQKGKQQEEEDYNVHVQYMCVHCYLYVITLMMVSCDIEERSIIILYCVNCEFSILSAPPCGNHMPSEPQSLPYIQSYS